MAAFRGSAEVYRDSAWFSSEMSSWLRAQMPELCLHPKVSRKKKDWAPSRKCVKNMVSKPCDTPSPAGGPGLQWFDGK